jgi:hypothetical protein
MAGIQTSSATTRRTPVADRTGGAARVPESTERHLRISTSTSSPVPVRADPGEPIVAENLTLKFGELTLSTSTDSRTPPNTEGHLSTSTAPQNNSLVNTIEEELFLEIKNSGTSASQTPVKKNGPLSPIQKKLMSPLSPTLNNAIDDIFKVEMITGSAKNEESNPSINGIGNGEVLSKSIAGEVTTSIDPVNESNDTNNSPEVETVNILEAPVEESRRSLRVKSTGSPSKRHASPHLVPRSSGGLITDVASPSRRRSNSPVVKATANGAVSASTNLSKRVFVNAPSHVTDSLTLPPKEIRGDSEKTDKMTPDSRKSKIPSMTNRQLAFSDQNRRLPAPISQEVLVTHKRANNIKNRGQVWSFLQISNPNDLGTGEGDGGIQVAVRVRPFTILERSINARRIVSTNGDKLVLVNPSAFDADPDTIAAAALATDSNDWAKDFRFDHCLWSYNPNDKEDIYIDQRGVYDLIGNDIVCRVLKGRSIFCFAYGHTGSGKTHTMFGNIEDSKLRTNVTGSELNDEVSVSCGLIPRVFCDIVNRILNDPELSSDTKITISFVEVYNEKVKDLLAIPYAGDSIELKVRERQGSAYIEGVSKIEVITADDVLKHLTTGLACRSIGSNSRNSSSSRSHALVSLEISPLFLVSESSEKTPISSPTKLSDAIIRVQMVDLAGSEKEFLLSRESEEVQRGVENDKLENKMIRKSLSTLAYIIKELNRGVPSRGLPFRDSVLTWLLKDALCGGCHTTMISTISPAHNCFEETLNTLKYARRLHQSVKKSSVSAAFTSLPSCSIKTIKTEVSFPISPKESSANEVIREHIVSAKKGSEAARSLLKSTINDPQQRLAKISFQEHSANMKNNPHEVGSQLRVSHTPTTVLKKKDFQDTPRTPNTIYERDNLSPNFKEAYRVLQGQFVEMQIEIEGLRTDRDSLLIELQNTKDLNSLNASGDKNDQINSKIVLEMTKKLKASEEKCAELRDLIIRKEEKFDSVLSDLAKEKDENARLRYNLSKQTVESDDMYVKTKQDKEEILKLQSLLQTLLAQNSHLKDENDSNRLEIGNLRATLDSTESNFRVRNSELSQQFLLCTLEKDHLNTKYLELLQKCDEYKSIQDLVLSLKEKLTEAEALNELKSKNIFEVEKSLRELKDKNLALDLIFSSFLESNGNSATHESLCDLEAALNEVLTPLHPYILFIRSLSNLKIPPNDTLHKESNESAKVPVEVEIFAAKITELESTIALIRSENSTLRRSLDQKASSSSNPLEIVLTDDIERKVLAGGSTNSVEETGRIRLLENKLQNLLVELESERHQKGNLEALLKAQITDEESLTELEILRKENSELKCAVLERNDLQAQNNLLQLKLESLNSLAANESEKNFSTPTIEKEYASLWLAVGELNKLDADKDKELRQLIFDRDEALEQRDLVLTKLEILRIEYEELRNHVEVYRNFNTIVAQIPMISYLHIYICTCHSKSISICTIQLNRTQRT